MPSSTAAVPSGAATDPTPDSTDHPAPPPARHGWVLAAVVVACAAPLAAVAVGLAVKGWAPVGEFAQAELRLRDFWGHPPLLGAVGRLRTGSTVSSHPGPAAWWAMYPVYAALGRSAVALSTAVAVMAGVWMAGALTLLWRRGGDAAVVVGGLVVVALIAAVGPTTFVEPWNPWFALMPFLCFVLAVWDTLGGHRWSLVLLGAAGSFCVQAHVGYAPLVGVLSLLGLVGIVVARWGRGEWRRLVVPAAVALLVMGLMWAPPVLEQLTNDPGNMTTLVDAYRQEAARQPALGAGAALKLVGAYLNVRAPVLVTEDISPVDRSADLGTVAVVAAWALAAWACWRRRADHRFAAVLRLHLVAAVGVLTAVVAASRIVGEVFGYLILWLGVLVAVAAFAILWTGWLAYVVPTDTPQRPRPRSRRALPIVGAVLALAAVLTTIGFADAPVPAEALSDDATDLIGPVAAGLDPNATHVVRWDDPLAFGGLGTAVLSELERRDLRVGVDERLGVEMRPHRVLEGSRADDAVWVVTGADIAKWRNLPGVTELASVDNRTPAERRRTERLAAGIRDRLRQLGGDELADTLDHNYWVARSDPRVDRDLRGRIDRLGALGLPTAVFLAPSTTVQP